MQKKSSHQTGNKSPIKTRSIHNHRFRLGKKRKTPSSKPNGRAPRHQSAKDSFIDALPIVAALLSPSGKAESPLLSIRCREFTAAPVSLYIIHALARKDPHVSRIAVCYARGLAKFFRAARSPPPRRAGLIDYIRLAWRPSASATLRTTARAAPRFAQSPRLLY